MGAKFKMCRPNISWILRSIKTRNSRHQSAVPRLKVLSLATFSSEDDVKDEWLTNDQRGLAGALSDILNGIQRSRKTVQLRLFGLHGYSD